MNVEILVKECQASLPEGNTALAMSLTRRVTFKKVHGLILIENQSLTPTLEGLSVDYLISDEMC